MGEEHGSSTVGQHEHEQEEGKQEGTKTTRQQDNKATRQQGNTATRQQGNKATRHTATTYLFFSVSSSI